MNLIVNQINYGGEFGNKLMQKWLNNNDILMYSTHKKGKSVTPERFIKTLKAKIYKKMSADHSKKSSWLFE